MSAPYTHTDTDARLQHLLMEFACGSLNTAEALVISSYTSLNPAAEKELSFYEDIGGALIDRISPTEVSDTCLDHILNVIETQDDNRHITDATPAIQPTIGKESLPPAIAHYVDCEHLCDLKWKKLFKGIDVIDIPVSDDTSTVRLMRFAPGFVAPEHGHHGGEMTVTLSGSYHDKLGHYKRGDIEIIQDDDGHHQPTACPEHGCICLVSTFAPLRFKKPLHRLVNQVFHF